MTKSIGAAMAGGNPTIARQENDYYPTPIECTIGLLDAEETYIRAHGSETGCGVWEPACGDGAMARPIEARGFTVVATDLIHRGFGQHDYPVDFLTADLDICLPIITNPPFNLAPAFIRRALEHYQIPYLALLLKSTFWHAKSRLPLFEDHPPQVVYPLTWRPDFMNRGAPTMDCSWMVWDRNRWGTSYVPMRKPTHV